MKFEDGIDYDNISMSEKEKLIITTIDKVNNSIIKYNKIISELAESGRIYLSIDGVDYKSNYINIEIYFDIRMFNEFGV